MKGILDGRVGKSVGLKHGEAENPDLQLMDERPVFYLITEWGEINEFNLHTRLRLKLRIRIGSINKIRVEPIFQTPSAGPERS